MILTIRTDKPEAEIGLFDGENKVAYKKWQAHRELSATIHKVINELLQKTGKDWGDITGVVFYKGPGSFTGLRIGAAVANALGFGNGVPVVSRSGENWIKDGIKAMLAGENEPALPEYGEPPHTTIQKK